MSDSDMLAARSLSKNSQNSANSHRSRGIQFPNSPNIDYDRVKVKKQHKQLKVANSQTQLAARNKNYTSMQTIHDRDYQMVIVQDFPVTAAQTMDRHRNKMVSKLLFSYRAH